MPEPGGGVQLVVDADEGRSDLPEQPVREYIASLSRELAEMARRDGDDPLGAVLDAAAMFAER